MKWLLASALVFSALLGWQSARGDTIPPCKPPTGTRDLRTLNIVPDALQRALDANVGRMADPGERFNATDVITEDLPANRLIFIWNRGDLWIVATEHGGIAYSDPIFAYRLATDAKGATLITTRSAIPSTVCAVAKELFKHPTARN